MRLALGGGQQFQKFGKSKGYFAAKFNVTTDSLGCQTKVILTGGNASDYTQALPLIEGQPADFVIADKGYDSQAIVDAIHLKGAEAVFLLARFEKCHRILTVTSIKREMQLNACSTNLSSSEEFQPDMTSSPSHIFRSFMLRRFQSG